AYEFVWGIYCDWYLELCKPVLAGPDGVAKTETRATVAWALDEILKLLHPFMPFITEALWAQTNADPAERQAILTLTKWPDPAGLIDPAIDEEMSWVVKVVSEIRSVRTEMNIPAGAKI